MPQRKQPAQPDSQDQTGHATPRRSPARRDDQLLAQLREQEARIARLEHELHEARRQSSAQEAQWRERIAEATLASEVQTLLRQELDGEALLRTTLECLLRKIGPVNAAIFLPDDHGDFALGAYVNYDCPREQAQDMLEELGLVLAPLFIARPGLHVIDDASRVGQGMGQEPGEQGEIPGVRARDPGTMRELAELAGMGGLSLDGPVGFIADATLAVYACAPHAQAQDQECSAVIAIFRDRRQPWDQRCLGTLRVMGAAFAEQLERVARTSTRHTINEKPWAG